MTTGTPQRPTELRNWWHDTERNRFWGECFAHPNKKNGEKYITAFVVSVEKSTTGVIIEDILGDRFLCAYEHQRILPEDIKKEIKIHL